jgi:hypothetical protein
MRDGMAAMSPEINDFPPARARVISIGRERFCGVY